jgi:O-antigen ligase
VSQVLAVPVGVEVGARVARPGTRRRGGTLTERMVCGYFTVLPVLWLLGLYLPAIFLLIIVAFFISVRSRRAWGHALPWFGVALAQITSIIINWAQTDQPFWMLGKHLLAGYASGWYMLGAAVGLGASGHIRAKPFLRAIARLGFASVVLGAVAYTLAFTSGQEQLHVLTPVGHLLPTGLTSTGFFFGLYLFDWQRFLGMNLPRIALFFPWCAIAGYAGLYLILIIANERAPRRRHLVTACGVLMVLASLSRLAAVALLVCLFVRWYLGRSFRLQIPLAAVGVTAATVLWMWAGSMLAVVQEAQDRMASMRPGSSAVRERIYEASWEGIRSAPILGHGWPGESVMSMSEDDQSIYGSGPERIVVGTHSTISGVLYKGGLLTFLALVFAFGRTAAVIGRSRGDPMVRRSTLALLVALVLTGIGEGLEALVVPTIFVYLWIGIALRASRPERQVA